MRASRTIGTLRRILPVAAAAGLAAAGFGCRATLPAEMSPGPTPTGNVELTAHIAELPYVTADAGYRAAYALRHGESSEADFEELAAQLRQERIIGDWDMPPNGLLDRSQVGYMIARAIDLKRGLNWQVTGLGRYAWRELSYLGIASASTDFGFVPGGEFLGILLRASDYQLQRRGSLTQRVDLGAPPG
jgi:hypothetical protein